MLDIPSNQIDLWLVEDSQVEATAIDEVLLAKYLTLLNKEEQQRYERLLFPKHKKQFLISRALVRTSLAQYLDEAPEDLVFTKNAYGKPRVGTANKDLKINFNLSHTDHFSVLAVSKESEIGVDTEFLTRQVDILKLAQRYFSESETSDIESLEASLLNERFFCLWTLKEAYIKACGMGLAIPLKDFSFHFNNKNIAISFSEERDDSPEFWSLWQFIYKDGFQIALASKDEKQNSAHNTKLLIRSGVPLAGYEFYEAKDIYCSE